MAGHRVGFLAAATPGGLVAAWVVGMASLSQIGGTGNVKIGRTFVTSGYQKDKVYTGDGVLTFDDVSDLTCCRKCLKELVCGFFFHNPVSRACALAPPPGKNTTLTDAPGYQLYATSEGPSGSPSDDRKLCPDGTASSRGCWRHVEASGVVFQHVSVGPAGAWGAGSDEAVYYFDGTYDNPAVMGRVSGAPIGGTLSQMDVGTDALWGVNSVHRLWYRSGITSASPEGSGWGAQAGDQLQWVSVSPLGSVWAVNTTGHLLHGPNAASGSLPVDQWDVVEAVLGLQRVDAGRAGVWALDNAGRLHYRLGIRGQDGVVGTGWRQVGGTFTSVSSGADLVVAVDLTGDVWIRTSLGADTAASLGWRWLSGGMAQVEIYQSGDVTTMWALDGLGQLYFFLL